MNVSESIYIIMLHLQNENKPKQVIAKYNQPFIIIRALSRNDSAALLSIWLVCLSSILFITFICLLISYKFDICITYINLRPSQKCAFSDDLSTGWPPKWLPPVRLLLTPGCIIWVSCLLITFKFHTRIAVTNLSPKLGYFIV